MPGEEKACAYDPYDCIIASDDNGGSRVCIVENIVDIGNSFIKKLVICSLAQFF